MGGSIRRHKNIRYENCKPRATIIANIHMPSDDIRVGPLKPCEKIPQKKKKKVNGAYIILCSREYNRGTYRISVCIHTG